MATRMIAVDDLDGSELKGDAEDFAVYYGWGGRRYQIDLAPKNKAKLEAALKPFLEVSTDVTPSARETATRTTGTRRTSSGTGAKTDPAQLQAMRTWARENGFENVSDRGRVSQAIQDAYNAAN